MVISNLQITFHLKYLNNILTLHFFTDDQETEAGADPDFVGPWAIKCSRGPLPRVLGGAETPKHKAHQNVFLRRFYSQVFVLNS